jgi:hypothetical protein
MNEDEANVDIICKNCQHPMSMHIPHCTVLLHGKDNKKICDCNNPEFYNAVISGKYIGWTEIHCNNCGKLLAFIDSSSENIYDFIVKCKKCIIQFH